MILRFNIDSILEEIELLSEITEFGENVVLSSEKTDVTYQQPWYNLGFSTFDLFDEFEFKKLYEGITSSIKKIIENNTNLNLDNFDLKNYHNFVVDDEDHFSVVKQTRDLYPNDFNLNVKTIIEKLESHLNHKLSFVDPISGWNAHIILRINRPNSKDYNPPHKDIYEHLDDENYIPQFINFWIPICGVNEKSSLPIVPKSHHINESKIRRTKTGAILKNSKYRIRILTEWGDIENKLYRTKIKDGQVLVFTPHLIHGLATNRNNNLTRVALEFRLYKK